MGIKFGSKYLPGTSIQKYLTSSLSLTNLFIMELWEIPYPAVFFKGFNLPRKSILVRIRNRFICLVNATSYVLISRRIQIGMRVPSVLNGINFPGMSRHNARRLPALIWGFHRTRRVIVSSRVYLFTHFPPPNGPRNFSLGRPLIEPSCHINCYWFPPDTWTL